MRGRARINLRRVVAERSLARSLPPAAPAPVVKWAGGKGKLLPELLARRPQNYRRYFEPFLGGAALFFRLGPSYAVLNDKNPDLINMYRCLAWNVEAVIRRLTRHRLEHSQEYYYATRARWNEEHSRIGDVDRAATFIYLNKTCYNGLWRVNSRGFFNVPAGRYHDPQIFNPEVLRAASRLLQNAELKCGPFAEAVESAEAGDFVYFDPPYHPLNETARFTSYTCDNFGADDQRELAAVARGLAARGAVVMISNSDVPFIRKLYTGFRIDSVECARAINSQAERRGPISEVIISNLAT
jgi:DNA adenine methylase